MDQTPTPEERFVMNKKYTVLVSFGNDADGQPRNFTFEVLSSDVKSARSKALHLIQNYFSSKDAFVASIYPSLYEKNEKDHKRDDQEEVFTILR